MYYTMFKCRNQGQRSPNLLAAATELQKRYIKLQQSLIANYTNIDCYEWYSKTSLPRWSIERSIFPRRSRGKIERVENEPRKRTLDADCHGTTTAVMAALSEIFGRRMVVWTIEQLTCQSFNSLRCIVSLTNKHSKYIQKLRSPNTNLCLW